MAKTKTEAEIGTPFGREIVETPLEKLAGYRREQSGYRTLIVRIPTHIINEFAEPADISEPDLLVNARAKVDTAFNNVISGHDKWIETKEMLSCGECGRAVK